MSVLKPKEQKKGIPPPLPGEERVIPAPVDPEDPPLTAEEPDVIPEEDPFENPPPFEEPEPGEGP